MDFRTPGHPHLLALRQTRRWCHPRADLAQPAASLRSAVLRPPEYPDAWSCTRLHPAWIEQLVARRAALLPETDHEDAVPAGRVLAVLEDADTHMGEGEPASRGVVDDVYLPPWDTWFAYLPLGRAGVLLAWIPSAFEPLVEAARVVAATEPLAWLDDLPSESPAFSGDRWSEVSAELRRHTRSLEAQRDD
ncbi:hypothetical protein [Deinococcus pimensis]|uniref:hypothetical protein n=1 Tax=Deinococcus pimensis TaxID=309888 RepID=UPI00048750BA|nr:hypothetical protein [Deinococcus pimensis]